MYEKYKRHQKLTYYIADFFNCCVAECKSMYIIKLIITILLAKQNIISAKDYSKVMLIVILKKNKNKYPIRMQQFTYHVHVIMS